MDGRPELRRLLLLIMAMAHEGREACRRQGRLVIEKEGGEGEAKGERCKLN
jgi:hypothetical protein